MSELAEVIDGILSNPEEMKKIMDIAGKFMDSGDTPDPGAPAAAPKAILPEGSAMPSGAEIARILAGLGGLSSAAQR
ncbi:MAG: hypothetical protein LBL15_01575, partial [Oscillospiraceae bacterium]|nr:hypothetical protein [Oscillospiraceae bacterium]